MSERVSESLLPHAKTPNDVSVAVRLILLIRAKWLPAGCTPGGSGYLERAESARWRLPVIEAILI